MRRRERYYRVERTCRGFYVPDHVRQEAATQTWADMHKLQEEWWNFSYDNYISDMTPIARGSATGKLIVLDWIQNFGFWRYDAWNRYFFNETDPGWLSQEEVATIKDRKKFPFNLTTAEGKREFEAHVKSQSTSMPGYLVPEGQEFDFEAHYKEIGV